MYVNIFNSILDGENCIINSKQNGLNIDFYPIIEN